MRRYLKPLTIALTGAAILWCAPGIGGLAQAENGERSFTLSTDPEAVVLRYTYSGGMRPSVVYTLYGDGRLVHERVKEAAHHSSDRVEMQLGFLERENVVRIATDAGLVECDGDCIEEKCRTSLGIKVIPPTADCREVLLTLSLASYQGPDDSAPRPVQTRIYLQCPSALATAYCPDVQEVQRLRELGRALNRYKTAAMEVEQ